jgi:hypothetical protein
MCTHDFVETPEYYVCCHCFEISTIFVHSIDMPISTVITSLPYTPITHFKARLYQLQGKQVMVIPPFILDQCASCRTFKEILDLLKSIKMAKYYKHVFKICSILGLPIPFLSYEEEEQAITIFKQKIPLKTQHNNIPYQFILYKIMELLNRTDILPYLQISKNKTKLKKYECIFFKNETREEHGDEQP